MADVLKPGGFAAGEFSSSMAQAMENALNDLLFEEGKPLVSTVDSPETRDRRIMFLAIARGVVAHLVAHPGAFEIRNPDNSISTLHISIQS